MDQPPSIMQRLRDETQDAHAHTEKTSFFAALLRHELPLASYIGYLRALATVHEALETALSHTSHPGVRAVWDDSLRKLPWLQQDLAHLEAEATTETPAAELCAQVMAQRIRQRAEGDPISLLGYLYVCEGSTLGGMILQAHAAQSWGLTRTSGLAYLSSYEEATAMRWRRFKRRMEHTGADANEQERIVEAAREAFACVARLAEALHPLSTRPRRGLARALNPEAGAHSIPTDMREVQAALRAGEHSLREFPYYILRYGERGERFTRSDSAWLVTLTRYDMALVERQILWLGQLLSSRGMPLWLMERHLELLHDELVAAVPDKQADYAKLRQVADRLREMRHRYIPGEAFQAITYGFAQQVGPEWDARLPHTGGLLAAAVADEKSGIDAAVSSIEEWMTDSERFPPSWIDAVRQTIRAAWRIAG
jgi:heme oxygenase